MANVSTMDTDAAVAQAIRMIEAGAEYIRFAAQGEREARNLENIHRQLREKGYQTPLIVDVHFNPKVAEAATGIVEKVRINPGNYTKQTDHDADSWDAEINRIRERFIPFLDLCRRHGTAIRIGVNHGSLSERMMRRYGDTPEGMVESCMEFLRICREQAFDEVVISIKSSNTVVMVKTIRLLVHTMEAEGMHYPLHLGVTEAGNEEDGRIKSAIGIGSLLIDGIGDTIRVSLSEPPEAELPVARKIIDYILERAKIQGFKDSKILSTNFTNLHENTIQDSKFEIQGSRFKVLSVTDLDFSRPVRSVGVIGGANPPAVISDRLDGDFSVDSRYIPDFLYIGDATKYPSDTAIPLWIDIDHWQNRPNTYPYFQLADLDKLKATQADMKLLEIDVAEPDDTLLEVLQHDKTVVVVLNYTPVLSVYLTRIFVSRLMEAGCDVPVILRCDYSETDPETLQIKAAIDFGALLVDGIGNGVFLCNKQISPCMTDMYMFSILQAARVRISKTDYISCPGCGRTLYDLETTVARIKQATSHLKGLKIGIMGCIVNGPGEMADADYGYVGAGQGRINLYKKHECVLKNIPEEDAVEQLINLIKANGEWGEIFV
jgi:(E)-4-hydroxy-3-methylbut-2-enyl-diphosphate synthase